MSKCDTCKESTNYIYTFKDGPNGPSYTFHCKNENCPEGKLLRDSIARDVKLVSDNRELNEQNECDIEQLKLRKFIAGLTFYNISNECGIPVTTISEYFNYRKPITKEDYLKIDSVLSKSLR